MKRGINISHRITHHLLRKALRVTAKNTSLDAEEEFAEGKERDEGEDGVAEEEDGGEKEEGVAEAEDGVLQEEDGVAEDGEEDVDVVVDLIEQLCQQDSLNVSHVTFVLYVKKPQSSHTIGTSRGVTNINEQLCVRLSAMFRPPKTRYAYFYSHALPLIYDNTFMLGTVRGCCNVKTKTQVVRSKCVRQESRAGRKVKRFDNPRNKHK